MLGCDGTVAGGPVRDAGHDSSTDANDSEDSGEELDAGIDATVPTVQRDVCSADGWCWELPHPQGHEIRGLWAQSVDDVWAVGVNGTVLHNDGFGWSRAESPTTSALNAVYGVSSDDVWAAGDGGVVVHYDGTRWSLVPTAPPDAMPAPVLRTLRAIWGSASDDVWFAGDNGTVLHFDGTLFTTVTSSTTQRLHGLWGSANDDVWAVGLNGIAIRFDGTDWSTVATPGMIPLFSIHGIATNNIWAVGTRGAIHWDGTNWSAASDGLDAVARAVVALPAQEDMTVDAGLVDAGIADAAADDAAVAAPTLAWAFGDGGKVWKYRNGAWSPVASNLAKDFLAATPMADDDILAAGEGGVLQRWVDGARQTLSAGSNAARLSTFVAPNNKLWVGGDELLSNHAGVWAREMPPTQRALFGLWGNESELWAVGTMGTVLNFDGSSWIDLAPVDAEDRWLRAVHGAGSTIWIVGDGGLALTRAAGTWTAVSTGRNVGLRDIWTLADDDAWAVGDNATALHWNGSAWDSVDTTITSASLRALWASASDDVWAVGSLGSVIHWNGSAWSADMMGGSYSLDDVVGHDGELWTVGNAGTILHFDGSSWTAEQSGTTHNLHSITIDQSRKLWTVGDQGTVLFKQL